MKETHHGTPLACAHREEAEPPARSPCGGGSDWFIGERSCEGPQSRDQPDRQVVLNMVKVVIANRG